MPTSSDAKTATDRHAEAVRRFRALAAKADHLEVAVLASDESPPRIEPATEARVSTSTKRRRRR